MPDKIDYKETVFKVEKLEAVTKSYTNGPNR